MQDMQAESAGLTFLAVWFEFQVDTEQDTKSDFCERIDALEADLTDKTERAVSAEDKADCLEADSAAAIARLTVHCSSSRWDGSPC